MSGLFSSLKEQLPKGAALYRQRLSLEDQRRMLDDVARIMALAPPFRPQMPTGPLMINRLTNCGTWGWFSDRRGYRYEALHPVTRVPWPPIPTTVLSCARAVAHESGASFEPDACLINLYEADGRLSLHRDYDEADLSWPIVSLSFGNDAEFQLGGLNRSGPSTTFTLNSGDVFVLAGESRLRYHGVRRIHAGTSPIDHPALPQGGRINLTLRRAR
ncbi:MAG: alpha-ketoglutarate-dependent dioxygenase AlkB [Micropepsaceae bacterium]